MSPLPAKTDSSRLRIRAARFVLAALRQRLVDGFVRVVPAASDRARRHDRYDRRARRRRLLRRAGLCTHFFLEVLAGYSVPTPAAEGHVAGSVHAARPWALPLVAGAGALLGVVSVYRFAPEAEGHGTDATISAVHHNPKGVRFRAVIVKIVASALHHRIGGIGRARGPDRSDQRRVRLVARRPPRARLDPVDGRIAVATGIGSGIGAIFGAPLGGAVLAAEILYRDDFDPAALLPCFIASSASYAVFGSVEGFGPLFGYVGSYRFSDPAQLGWFALIGILGGLIGILYAKGFYGIAPDLDRRAPSAPSG